MEQAKPRILVVEDEAAIRDGLADVLVYHGYQVDAVADGKEGLAKALSGKYDLLLLDVMLPGRDGFSICDEVRKVDRDQPIIMLTAKTSDEDIVNGLTLGADDYVAKPFAIAQLVLRVKAVLRRSRVGVESAAKIALDGASKSTRATFRAAAAPRRSRSLGARSRSSSTCSRTQTAPCRARSCSRASGATTARPRSKRARSTSTSPSCGARSSPTQRSRAIS